MIFLENSKLRHFVFRQSSNTFIRNGVNEEYLNLKSCKILWKSTRRQMERREYWILDKLVEEEHFYLIILKSRFKMSKLWVGVAPSFHFSILFAFSTKKCFVLFIFQFSFSDWEIGDPRQVLPAQRNTRLVDLVRVFDLRRICIRNDNYWPIYKITKNSVFDYIVAVQEKVKPLTLAEIQKVEPLSK